MLLMLSLTLADIDDVAGSAPAVTKAAAKNAKRRANKKKGEGNGAEEGVEETTAQLGGVSVQDGQEGAQGAWNVAPMGLAHTQRRHRPTKADTGAAEKSVTSRFQHGAQGKGGRERGVGSRPGED